jgi:hypothetical protein
LKHLTIFFGFCSLLFFACHKEDLVLTPIDPFTILPNSGKFLSPYYGKDQVVFVDSLGNELIFKVKTSLNDIKNYAWRFYDVNMVGDTVEKLYPCTGDKVILTDTSNTLQFSLEVFPELYLPTTDSSSVKTVDRAFIWFHKKSYPHIYSVYSKILDARDSTEPHHSWSFNIIEPTRTFLGQSFSDVEHTDYTNPHALIYYNNTYGIVAFSDYDHKIWRLKF